MNKIASVRVDDWTIIVTCSNELTQEKHFEAAKFNINRFWLDESQYI